jgi:cytoskeletal protein CcmA (bactofilin family)
MAKDVDPKSLPRFATRLGGRTHFNGTLRFREPLRISGRFQGEIVSGGFLYVEEGAVVEANIKAEAVVVAGTVRGNIHATQRLEMLPSGEIHGNVKTSKLRIADGVVFEGKCEMLRNSGDVDIFAGPVPHVKDSVQRV